MGCFSNRFLSCLWFRNLFGWWLSSQPSYGVSSRTSTPLATQENTEDKQEEMDVHKQGKKNTGKKKKRYVKKLFGWWLSSQPSYGVSSRISFFSFLCFFFPAYERPFPHKQERNRLEKHPISEDFKCSTSLVPLWPKVCLYHRRGAFEIFGDGVFFQPVSFLLVVSESFWVVAL
jgi:hypothetical protein